MSDRCIICTFVEAAHPEVGNGYVPHPFEEAAIVHAEAYDGPERRVGIRRMGDRVEAIERAMAAAYDEPEPEPDRRGMDRRSA